MSARRRANRVEAAPACLEVLEAIDLVAGYIPEVNILNGCNLVVNEGEFVGIIGPNGAGKSTLLKAVLGLCTIRSGHGDARRRRTSPGSRPTSWCRSASATCRRTSNVFPSLTVRENLEMGCFLRPSMFESRFEYVTELFPRLARAGRHSAPARCRVASARWWRWVGR